MTSEKKTQEKTAIKLINKYADSYNRLLEENSSLKEQVSDLDSNLQLNKQIISELLEPYQEGKSVRLLNKLNLEIIKIYSQYSEKIKELSEVKEKLKNLKEIGFDYDNEILRENRDLKMKIFILEQDIAKKNAKIKLLQIQLENKGNYQSKKEIYILEPSKGINKMNDELSMYKALHSKLVKTVKESNQKYQNCEIIIEDLKKKNGFLKKKLNHILSNINREKENIRTLFTNSQNYTQGNALTEYSNPLLMNQNSLFNLSFLAKIAPKEKMYIQTEDFRDVLKYCGIKYEQYKKLASKKSNEKLVDIIEVLYKMLEESKLSVSLLEKENADLNMTNIKLNKRNMGIFDGSTLKNETKSTYIETKKNDDSLCNNTSAITNIALKSLLVYEKMIEKGQTEVNQSNSLSLEETDK